MLHVKLLGARAPVVAHPGEDPGYDLFAPEGDLRRGAGQFAGADRASRYRANQSTDRASRRRAISDGEHCDGDH
jgi:hypothetical protein